MPGIHFDTEKCLVTKQLSFLNSISHQFTQWFKKKETLRNILKELKKKYLKIKFKKKCEIKIKTQEEMIN